LFSENCAWRECISNIKYMPSEIIFLLKVLYTEAAVIMILAIYLSQVIPQQYGVTKHPLFPLEGIIKMLNPNLHEKLFSEDDK
jgi:hypothetical protein